MSSEPKLRMVGVSVSYGDEVAVDGLDLELGDGEIMTLVGPTGCGKTTTLRVVAGLEQPDSGEVCIDGRCVSGETFVPPEERGVGLVFQDFAIFPHLNVEENVGFRLRDTEQVDRWIGMLGLEDQRGKAPSSLSGGQKQRVALARSLAHEPSLVLLDEPLSNLDADMRDTLMWEIRDALKSAGVAAIWVTHDQEEALLVGDRVGVVKDGKVRQLGPPEEVFHSPGDRFVARFLGEASFLRGEAADDVVETAIGPLMVELNGYHGDAIEVMVRPDDLALVRASRAADGAVVYERYEGATRLYGVELRDGTVVRVRLNHEDRFEVGDAVDLEVSASYPFPWFPAEEAGAPVEPVTGTA